MQPEKPSLTALWVASARARHQLLDQPVVFDDPIAVKIIGEASASAMRLLPPAFEDLMSRAMRALVVARSRITEDALHAAVERGVSQLVVMGAGLDTFAYRNPYPRDKLQVFEVDHPATQAWKRALLVDAGIALPASLQFVPVDFETQAMPQALREAGFDADRQTFYSWLGVTMYLQRETVVSTLQHIAQGSPAGSEVAFDFIVEPRATDVARRVALAATSQFFAVLGEPWKTSFEPHALAARLRRLGLHEVHYISQHHMNDMLFKRRRDRLRVRSLGLCGMMLARV
jgi:methyltransferase (TIGR00027 family)